MIQEQHISNTPATILLEAAERRTGKIEWCGQNGPNPDQDYHFCGDGDDIVKLVNGEIESLPQYIKTNCSGAVMSVLLDADHITVSELREQFNYLQRSASAAHEEGINTSHPYKVWYQGLKSFLGLDHSSALYSEHEVPPDPRLLFPIKMTEFKLNSELLKAGSLIFSHGIEVSNSLIHIAISTGEVNSEGIPIIYSLETNARWGKRALHEAPLFSKFYRNYIYVTQG